MREIKFRGKNTYTKEWVYGFYLEQDTYIMGSKKTKENLLIKAEGLIVEDSTKHSGIPIDKETIGQYTGLHDKNEKEIYEGDIVKKYYYEYDKNLGEIEKYNIEEIKFDVDICCFNISIFDNLEVIGNIYNNKNLLESEDKQ